MCGTAWQTPLWPMLVLKILPIKNPESSNSGTSLDLGKSTLVKTRICWSQAQTDPGSWFADWAKRHLF